MENPSDPKNRIETIAIAFVLLLELDCKDLLLEIPHIFVTEQRNQAGSDLATSLILASLYCVTGAIQVP